MGYGQCIWQAQVSACSLRSPEQPSTVNNPLGGGAVAVVQPAAGRAAEAHPPEGAATTADASASTDSYAPVATTVYLASGASYYLYAPPRNPCQDGHCGKQRSSTNTAAASVHHWPSAAAAASAGVQAAVTAESWAPALAAPADAGASASAGAYHLCPLHLQAHWKGQSQSHGGPAAAAQPSGRGQL